MSAIRNEENRIAKDINLVYDFTNKPNRTNLVAQPDRAVVAKLRADLVLPENNILTVDIDFNTTSGYHDNTMMVMDDFGVEIVATAFEVKYGKEHAEKIRQAWANKQHEDDPRKPTYLLVQKPSSENELPKVYAACGTRRHQDAPHFDSIL
ncbi:hypothetical protein [Thalassotalea sp. PLHSN55]|uniref:hypothetical protein n=1 Tax=Thalassotalea sp. PLHSN55 TaxID=3435888 RepID=UPI003F83A820